MNGKIVEPDPKEPIEVIREFYTRENQVWPRDWIELSIEIAHHRPEAITELVDILEDNDIIAPIMDQAYVDAIEGYLDMNGITEDHWDVLFGRFHKEIDFVKTLHMDGGGFKVHIDQTHARAIGVKYGDLVHVTIRPS